MKLAKFFSVLQGTNSVKIALRILMAFVVLAILLPPLLATTLFLPGPSHENRSVIIPHGMNAQGIADLLDQSRVVWSSRLFRGAARLVAGGQLKAGEYEFPAGINALDIVRMIHNGQSVVRLATVAEGLTSAEIIAQLNDDPALTGAVDTVPAEGSLWPETYRYSYGDSRAGIITRMQKAMQDHLNEIWAGRSAAALPSIIATPHDALVLASIVEKETGKPEERPRIAGVFFNRLRQGMKLQSDPTVIYALSNGRGDFGRTLSHQDMSFPSPYNTYVHEGLPPQPICNPGRAALEAVIHPEANDYLYFVADGTGHHVFARSLGEHNQNVAHWRQMKQIVR